MIVLHVNDHGKPPDHSISDIILIKKSQTIGDSLSSRGWSAVGTNSTPDLARLPTTIPGI
jgi:hypothetical protein